MCCWHFRSTGSSALRIQFLLISVSCFAAAQSKLAFEVVSIKPAPQQTPETIRSGSTRIAFNVNRARVEISGYTPLMLLNESFSSGAASS
jgi:hypothetical protein